MKMKVCPGLPKYDSVTTVRKYSRKKCKAEVGGSISVLNKPRGRLEISVFPRSEKY